MAWTDWYESIGYGDEVLYTHLNRLSDNLDETMPGLATTAGCYFVADGANSIVERTIDEANINTNESTTSTSFTDLASPGPQVTASSGTVALISVTAQFAVTTAGETGEVQWVVSGASSLNATALAYTGLASGDVRRQSGLAMSTLLTAGSNTFKLEYRSVGGGTVSFSNRRIAVWPF